MSTEGRRNDSAPVLDVVPLDEEGCRACPSSPTEHSLVSRIDRARNSRAEQSQRELYQNHFPDER